MSYKTILLDNGHGGVINGVYQTPGKRSPKWKDGSQLFEGEFNRVIVNGIIHKLAQLNIPYVNITPEYGDISLETRVKRANEYPDSVLISVHSNAGGGNGFEAYTYYGTSQSDTYATYMYEEFIKEFPTSKVRTDYIDHDIDKESNLYILRKTIMPAVLTENFFMDNFFECKEYLMSGYGRERIVKFHVEAIKRIVEFN